MLVKHQWTEEKGGVAMFDAGATHVVGQYAYGTVRTASFLQTFLHDKYLFYYVEQRLRGTKTET